jgi:ABC-type nickel/cobalt efflux system permease component RcnA
MGPDHLAAVAPLAAAKTKKAWSLGVRWGTGHASGVTLVAILTWLLREILPIEKYSNYCERLVGVMLIAIGIWGLRKALRFELHTHEHKHEGHKHMHIHSHDENTTHTTAKITPHVHTHAALGVGILHGLAGGSHFLGVLPALAMPTKSAAGAYIISFGLGTIAAMAGFSATIGLFGTKILRQGPAYFKSLMASFSVIAIGVGVYWLR